MRIILSKACTTTARRYQFKPPLITHTIVKRILAMDIGRHESESMVAGLSLLLFVVLPPAKAGAKREKQEQWDSILGGHQTHSFQDAASFFHTEDVPAIESWARAQGTVEGVGLVPAQDRVPLFLLFSFCACLCRG